MLILMWYDVQYDYYCRCECKCRNIFNIFCYILLGTIKNAKQKVKKLSIIQNSPSKTTKLT